MVLVFVVVSVGDLSREHFAEYEVQIIALSAPG
jgi:hypothetical protein